MIFHVNVNDERCNVTQCSNYQSCEHWEENLDLNYPREWNFFKINHHPLHPSESLFQFVMRMIFNLNDDDDVFMMNVTI